MNTQANHDAREIAKFTDIAHRWWDPHGEFKPLHEINPLRLSFIEKHFALRGQRIADIGCGGGLLSEAMAAKGAIVTGIDMGEANIDTAKLHLLESGLQVEYLHCPAEQLAQERVGQYDAITCMEMLEHVPDPIAIIDACTKLVKPGGMVFFSSINRNAKSYLHAIIGAEYILKLLPKGTHDYRKLIKPSELASWCRGAGLEIQELRGMGYDLFTKQYFLGDDVAVNYLGFARKG